VLDYRFRDSDSERAVLNTVTNLWGFHKMRGISLPAEELLVSAAVSESCGRW